MEPFSVAGEFPACDAELGCFFCFLFFFIWAWTKSWANNGDAGDLKRHHAHYYVIVMDMQNKYNDSMFIEVANSFTATSPNESCV